MRLHTCHPTQVNVARLNPSQSAGTVSSVEQDVAESYVSLVTRQVTLTQFGHKVHKQYVDWVGQALLDNKDRRYKKEWTSVEDLVRLYQGRHEQFWLRRCRGCRNIERKSEKKTMENTWESKGQPANSHLPAKCPFKCVSRPVITYKSCWFHHFHLVADQMNY